MAKASKSDINIIRNKILAAIEISKRSGVPILLTSNPGMGKTTTVQWYARKSGMHLETVIGSHYSPDELLGFQARTLKKYLEIIEPEWYHRIMAYSEPHFEKKSSGWNYEFIEEDDIELWRNKLKESKELYEKAVKNLADANANGVTNPLELKFLNIDVTKQEQRIKKYTAYLEDADWVDGRPSILFLDELTTATGLAQGALLQLCFEYKIRGDKKLPENCMIIGAANYKHNLTGYNNIIAPELNRFCIVNLLYGDKHSSSNNNFAELGKNMVNEFLQGFKDVEIEMPKYRTDFTFDENTSNMFLADVRSNFISLFESYSSNVDTSKFVLDLRNVVYDDLYDRDDDIPDLYNFLTPRTMSYYARVVKAMCEMGIGRGGNIYKTMVDGLIGFGTNTFVKGDVEAFKAQIDEYQNKIYIYTSSLLDKYKGNQIEIKGESKKIDKVSSIIIDENTATSKVKKLINLSIKNELGDFTDATSNGRVLVDDSFNLITSLYPTETSASKQIEMFSDMFRDTAELLSFRSDYESAIELETFCRSQAKSNSYLAAYSIYADTLKSWIDIYSFYYTMLGKVTME